MILNKLYVFVGVCGWL